MDEHTELSPLPSQGGSEQGSSDQKPHDDTASETKTAPGAAGEPGDKIYEVSIGHRRYFATTVDGVEVSVRVPLHVFESHNPKAYEEYAEELAKKVQAEQRKKYSQAWNNKQRMRKLIL